MDYYARHELDGTWSVRIDAYSAYSGHLGHVWQRGFATEEQARVVADRVNATHAPLVGHCGP